MLAEGEISPGIRKGILVDSSGRVILGTGSASSPSIGVRSGYVLKRVSATVTRPADVNAYTIADAVSNSTTAPTVFQLDLATAGAVAGQGVEIRRLSIVSSAKQPLLPLFNVFMSPTTFAATNDNSPLSIPATNAEAGGIFMNCDMQNSSAINAFCDYNGAPFEIILAPADTKLYCALQAANAYIPVSAEKFTIIAWIALL